MDTIAREVINIMFCILSEKRSTPIGKDLLPRVSSPNRKNLLHLGKENNCYHGANSTRKEFTTFHFKKKIPFSEGCAGKKKRKSHFFSL